MRNYKEPHYVVKVVGDRAIAMDARYAMREAALQLAIRLVAAIIIVFGFGLVLMANLREMDIAPQRVTAPRPKQEGTIIDFDTVTKNVAVQAPVGLLDQALADKANLTIDEHLISWDQSLLLESLPIQDAPVETISETSSGVTRAAVSGSESDVSSETELAATPQASSVQRTVSNKQETLDILRSTKEMLIDARRQVSAESADGYDEAIAKVTETIETVYRSHLVDDFTIQISKLTSEGYRIPVPIKNEHLQPLPDSEYVVTWDAGEAFTAADGFIRGNLALDYTYNTPRQNSGVFHITFGDEENNLIYGGCIFFDAVDDIMISHSDVSFFEDGQTLSFTFMTSAEHAVSAIHQPIKNDYCDLCYSISSVVPNRQKK